VETLRQMQPATREFMRWTAASAERYLL